MTAVTSKAAQEYARVGGVLYLVIIAAGIFAEVLVRSTLIVRGDASATATNILASEFLFRSGFAVELIMLVCDVAVAVIFYILLRPVNEGLALLAASFRVTMAAISGVNSLNHMDALLWLQATPYAVDTGPGLLHTMAYHSLTAHAYGYRVALVFFGFHCLFLGALIYRAGFLPKVLGGLMVVAGGCYLINSFVGILAPSLAASLGPGILLPAFVAELALALWMLARGIDTRKWPQASAPELLRP